MILKGRRWGGLDVFEEAPPACLSMTGYQHPRADMMEERGFCFQIYLCDLIEFSESRGMSSKVPRHAIECSGAVRGSMQRQ